MKTESLRTWLGLPPGPWPPDDRTLLGMPAGPTTAIDVETRAMAQMDKLRPYQLTSPDVVTEGMNRLAQAMIALSDEANRRASVGGILGPATPKRFAPPLSKPAPKRDDAADLILDADQLNPAPQSSAATNHPGLEPEVMDAEVLDAEVLDAEVLGQPDIPLIRTDAPRANPRPKSVAVPAIVVQAPPGATYNPAERRKGYHDLVSLRKLVLAWEKLQPYVASPSEPLDTPAAIFGYLQAAQDCRERLMNRRHLRLWFTKHGRIVLGVIRNPVGMTVLRELQPKQRKRLALDWAHATAALYGYREGLREELRSTRPKSYSRKLLRELRFWMRDNPEWLLGCAAAVVLGIGLIRTILKPSS